MSINPTSDIVLDVALAADPRRYEAAIARLRQLKGSAEIAAAAVSAPPTETAAPSATVGAVAQDWPAPASPGAGSTTTPSQAGIRAQKKPDAFAQLEAFVLQTFITEMLPKNAENVFGKGTAGDVWRSMLAEKLANEIASSGQVGIAKRLAAAQAARTVGTPAATGADNTPAAGAGVAPRAPLADILPYLQQQVADGVAGSDAPSLLVPSSKPDRS